MQHVEQTYRAHGAASNSNKRAWEAGVLGAWWPQILQWFWAGEEKSLCVRCFSFSDHLSSVAG
jgi:hypothetical protein